MSSELLDALDMLEKEKGISRDIIIEAIEAALVSAYKRNFNQAQNVRTNFNLTTGSMHVYARKEVVDEVFDSRLEISLDEARKINPNYDIGDIVEIEVTPKDFGRIAAQTAKQVVTQRVREAERGIIYEEFIDREDDIMTGIVQRKDNRFAYVTLGRAEALLPTSEQMPNEQYSHNDRIKVYITKVEKTTKGPQIYISRTHPNLLKRLFELEVPEIFDGTVEIMSVAREAGDRSKISVHSDNPEVDPVGACVGPKGSRVQAVVDELNGEKIDIVKYSKDPVEFVANALSPSKVLEVIVNEEEKSTVVIVPDYQLSLAIGKRGQNARLAAKLTGWKIDIKSESDAREAGIYPVEEPLFSPEITLDDITVDAEEWEKDSDSVHESITDEDK
ncbi:transcription termination factor NusA [Caldibacillus thermolactis]|jgi:transcription termination/antitermination protein NusA|uniref:Transcription termination/antitermination protein NusA n=1 Tax=Pallidibacillus thermolactis TaxID=251051 RepID=A0ABT2WE32_9BACI|nr:transcription termination factor NusA [Pallidibacillus thermolactis]MCU9593054.1 transcription termination factor NusA [Pallidibacillus thermolactis]MCU9600720.1 transcription termination factor NusA [Pallidibacillus thermolactis subsp. kokeshiiformis]MED1672044.1 transcription termination factor NusA [Pallidibacillus thermolactis subsp. kokeshiiformis]